MKTLEFQSAAWNTKSFNCLEIIEERLRKMIDAGQGPVRDICLHILNAGGKRVRPLLVWYSGLLFGSVSEELIRTAVAVELIHMASLIHDDLIDASLLRRHQPTVQKIWGEHRAVLAGDYLFAKAFGTLAESNLVKPLKIMAQTVETMCQGEISQDREQFNSQTSLDQYYERITKKTAVLLEASCKAGAWAGGADDDQTATIGKFGLNLGLAYQIIDDIMDICGDRLIIGKPKYTDLIRGNITLPLILLFQQGGHWVLDTLKRKEFNPDNLAKIETAVRTSGAMDQAYHIGVSHLETARNILNSFPKSPERQFLEDLTYKLQARAN